MVHEMDDSEAVLDEALQLGDEGRWEEMADLLARHIEKNSDEDDDPYLLCWLGVAEREMGNEGAAYDAFKRCLAAQPTDPYVLALAGSGLAAFDDPEAEPTLRAAALTAPDNPFTRLQYGAYLAREGMHVEALEHLNAAASLEPDDPIVRGELGIALTLAGDLSGATEAMETALELAPDDSWTRILLGLVHVERGDMERAAEELVRAAEERPDDGEAQVLTALAAAAAGWEGPALDVISRAEYSAEGVDSTILEEARERIEDSAEAARDLLTHNLAPSALHDRLHQPL
jgi:tetratricopeptide (TPR) repeat protein